jgi:2-methylisocitrate lyase-like PEP mutase family enzyme
MELVSQGLLHCLGVYDGISLAAAEQAGAKALYISGFALSASVLGLPDSGLITQTEMCDAIARLCGQTGLPVVADADTGYGDLANVARTMRLWEAAGVAALHVEDQVFPKACAQTRGVQLASAAEMAERITALVDARRSKRVWVIARTDAMPAEPLDMVLHRCVRYASAGADALFINAPQSRERFMRLATELRSLGKPLVFNAVQSQRTPEMSDGELLDCGVRLVLHPVAGAVEASLRLGEVYAALAAGQVASSPGAFAALAQAMESRHTARVSS